MPPIDFQVKYTKFKVKLIAVVCSIHVSYMTCLLDSYMYQPWFSGYR